MPSAAAERALTVVERAEQSPIAQELSAQSRALLSLLPDEAAVRRFQRVTIQALAKNPDLLECTPDSVINAVMEAASMGLEPTGGVGGAHLVPFNVNVGSKDRPRWEKRAQLVPDFRGVIRMLVRKRSDGTPSEVVAVEARTVKEGDEFAYTLGSAGADVHHVPTLVPDRSAKPTTHVYAVATLRGGVNVTEVMDRADVTRIQNKGKKRGQNPWDTDWDEMARKTVIKRLSKVLPVEPEVRAILAREDEHEPEAVTPVALPAAAPATARLAARLRPAPEPEAPEDPEPAGDVVEGQAVEVTEEAAGADVDLGDGPESVAAASGEPEPLTAEAFFAFLDDWATRHRADGTYAKALAKRLSAELFPGVTKLDDEQRARLAVRMEEED